MQFPAIRIFDLHASVRSFTCRTTFRLFAVPVIITSLALATQAGESPDSLVILKSTKTSVDFTHFSHRSSKFRSDGKYVVIADRRKFVVWETKTGLPVSHFPREQAEYYVYKVDFALKSGAVIATGPYTRLYQVAGFGSRSDSWIGGSIRTWKVSSAFFEFTPIVTELASDIAVPSDGNDIFAIRTDLVLCRFPIELEPKLRIQPELEIAPDPKYERKPGLGSPYDSFVLSEDSTTAMILVSDQDKTPGILYYSIPRKSCRFISGDEILLACGKELSRPNMSSDSMTCATLSNDGKAIFLAFNGDSDKIFVLDAETVSLKNTIALTDGCKIMRLSIDPNGRIAAQLKGNKISVIDHKANVILRDRSSAGGRTILNVRIVDDTLMLLIGGDEVKGELPPENQGNPRPFFIERIPLKPKSD